ncbi:GntR family transcriptional regulator [Kitasatospora kifunensis]|uniref:DNA-binding GntR family transcriptional regulator n=1 Tax=Kitasatospora kifunensis TaxID=58351 RepID=A0A7W7RAW7_KITKI|nr:GntR family transcriptional regulator [Kitasatospora kifunensis]MBB4928608.1 DNA-binding GntR family transcriptional regulator [Kitasatospora kifunensis]
MAKETSLRTQEVFDGIRSDLLNGELAPGQRLKLVALAERFGVSMSVVREALTRLAEQGLVVANPQRGFAVMPLSVDDLSDLTQTRVQLESLALRQAIALGGLEWESSVVAAHHTLERTAIDGVDGRLNEDWPAAHRAFHQALLSGAQSPRLEGVVNSLRDNAELYRRWYWSLTEDQVRDLATEHRRLRDLALARDADAAVTALAEHIGRAPRKLVAYAREHGLEDPTRGPAQA